MFSSNVRGLDVSHTPLFKKFLQESQPEARAADQRLASQVGQIIRIALSQDKFDVEQLEPDLGILYVAQPTVMREWDRWMRQCKKPATHASYTCQAKTGFKRMAMFLKASVAFMTDGMAPWVKAYEEVEGKWEPIRYTVEEVLTIADSLSSCVDAIMTTMQRAAKRRHREMKVSADQLFISKYKDGELL